jgi:hypothetical protein
MKHSCREIPNTRVEDLVWVSPRGKFGVVITPGFGPAVPEIAGESLTSDHP